jgi:hypothetical protein
MGNEKYSFLKQWFTFTFKKDNSTTLIYSCTNNHYIHTWFENHELTNFKNIMSKEILDCFIHAINESSNMIPSDFDKYFPDDYVKYYSLWDMDNQKHWSSLFSYRENCKEQMSKLFDNLWEIHNMIEDGTEGILKYHIYYTH